MSERHLRFWGVRGSYPAPYASHMKVGGNTPCVELRLGDQVIALDAGTGIIALGQALARQQRIRELTIILTHYHWDHISGLPFFEPAFLPGWRIRVLGPAGSADELEHLISRQMQAPYFPVETETWLANIEYEPLDKRPVVLNGTRISHFNAHHPGPTYGYRIEAGGKTLVYAPDNELAFINQFIDTRMEEFDADEQRLLDEMKEEQRWQRISFMENVDLLVHDAQYSVAAYEKKRGWGHSCYVDTVNAALDASVKDLRLFSHDPANDDDALAIIERHAMGLVRERRSNMACQLAREGETVSLDD
ncbi:MAG: MBL fold metallo-hydrolase [Gammaproteobacteria bacterium]